MRKGQADLFAYVFRGLLIIVLALLLLVQAGFILEAELPIEELDAGLIAERILNGPAGLSLTEPETGRPLPGTLDLTKFSSEGLASAYQEGFGAQNLWGGKLSFYESVEDMMGEKPSRVAFLDPGGVATRLSPLLKAGTSGGGSAAYYRLVRPVLYEKALAGGATVPTGRPDKEVSPQRELAIGWVVFELVKRR